MDYFREIESLQSFCWTLRWVDPYAHVWVLAEVSLQLLEHKSKKSRSKSPTWVAAEDFLSRLVRWAGARGALQGPIMDASEESSFSEDLRKDDLCFVAYLLPVFRDVGSFLAQPQNYNEARKFSVERVVSAVALGLARDASTSKEAVASALSERIRSYLWPMTNPQVIAAVTARSDPSAASIWVTWDLVAACDSGSSRMDKLRLAWLRCVQARQDWGNPLVRATFERLSLLEYPENTPIDLDRDTREIDPGST